MIPFSVYTATESPNALNWRDNPTKLPLLVWDLDPMVPLAHPSQTPNGISIRSAIFAQYISVTNTQTDTQTYRHRYV